MKIEQKNGNILITNHHFEVHIQPKIFGGYYLKKFIKNSPFEMIEMREIRINISEDDAIKAAQELLSQVYHSASEFKKLGIIPT